MKCLTRIRRATDYMKKHLQEDIRAQDVAEQVTLTPFFSRGPFC